MKGLGTSSTKTMARSPACKWGVPRGRETTKRAIPLKRGAMKARNLSVELVSPYGSQFLLLPFLFSLLLALFPFQITDQAVHGVLKCILMTIPAALRSSGSCNSLLGETDYFYRLPPLGEGNEAILGIAHVVVERPLPCTTVLWVRYSVVDEHFSEKGSRILEHSVSTAGLVGQESRHATKKSKQPLSAGPSRKLSTLHLVWMFFE